jgi:hypothetical protein
MLSSAEYIRQSLETHLFFARIMKEHSFFLEIGFTPKDYKYTSHANELRLNFDALLKEAIMLSNGAISPGVISSGEVFTPYTLDAEMASTYYTGIQLQSNLTQDEMKLSAGEVLNPNSMLEQRVNMLNQRAMMLISAIIDFKTLILTNVLSCKMFTVNYPLLIDHILREAKFYMQTIQRLQIRQDIDIEKQAYEQETFWNRIMAEHSKFIRGLLDPTEDALIEKANNFGKEFDTLTNEAIQSMDKTLPLKKVTDESLNATKELRDFKEQGTKGILECKVKSIIIPLLGDHVLREANHYLRLLKMFEVK